MLKRNGTVVYLIRAAEAQGKKGQYGCWEKQRHVVEGTSLALRRPVSRQGRTLDWQAKFTKLGLSSYPRRCANVVLHKYNYVSSLGWPGTVFVFGHRDTKRGGGGRERERESA
jgi:hypothetical protein